MEALTLYQPWASLVAIGAKQIETRSWHTSRRGPLAIHAAISRKYLNTGWREPFFTALKPLHKDREGGSMSLMWWMGCVVAICELVDCIEITAELLGKLSQQEIAFGDYALGRYAWILEKVVPLEKPVRAKGQQRLWNWENEGGGE